MKLVGVISTAVLFLLLGTTSPAYAEQQEEHAQEAKPAEHAQQKQEARQAKSSQNVRQEQEAGQAKSAQRAGQKQEAQHVKSAQHAEQKQEAQQAKSAQHAQRQEHAQQAERVSANRGGRIPDDRFRAHFGRDHRFRINRPTIVAGYQRFQYGGYWFGFVDPWPADWYYTDDVYVDYIDDGYYLYNPVHPGVRIAINVVL
jgi:flagellar motor protein MotB